MVVSNEVLTENTAFKRPLGLNNHIANLQDH